MWISNAPFADIAVVWAKDEAGDIRGMVVERGWKGFTTPETHGKWSLRASATAARLNPKRSFSARAHVRNALVSDDLFKITEAASYSNVRSFASPRREM